MNETRDEGEQGATGDRQPELVPDIVGVQGAFGPVAGPERLQQRRAGSRVPALVDAVQGAGQLVAVRPLPQEPFQTAAEFGGRDLPRIGLADRRQVRGRDQAGLDEGQAIVEFDAVDVEAGLGNPEQSERAAVEYALIGQIMDREDGRNVSVVPFQIAGDQRALPIVCVNQIGRPILVDQPPGELSGGVGEGREPHIVVAPIRPAAVSIGRAIALVQCRTAYDVIAQTVDGVSEIDIEGRQGSEGLAPTHGLEIAQAAQDRRIARDDDAYVSKIA